MASANKELRGQINRIKETINKVLKEDTTLRERLKTLFKEQGITIVSILTGIGMIIGITVEAVISTTGCCIVVVLFYVHLRSCRDGQLT